MKYNLYQTFANYIVKFLDAYEEHNISFWAISTGNEPDDQVVPKMNSMIWTPNTAGKWVSENLGPTLAASIHNDTKILLIDSQRFFVPWYLTDIFSQHPNARNYSGGIAIHWYMDDYVSPKVLDETLQLYPDLFLLMTEASLGEKVHILCTLLMF